MSRGFLNLWVAPMALTMLIGFAAHADDAAEAWTEAKARVEAKARAKASPPSDASKRYDQPDRAELFALKKRLPPGETRIAYERYAAARERADRLPVIDSASGRMFAPGRAPSAVSWTEKGPGNIGGRTRAIAFDPVTPTTMYTGGVAGGVFKSTNGGTSWTAIGDLMGNLAVTQLVVDRTNGQRIWAGTGEGQFNVDAQRGAGIFMSTDGGASWNQLASTNTSDFYRVNALIQSPNNANTLYAATRIGVFRSTDSGTSWTAYAETQGHVGGCFDLDAKPGTSPDLVIASCGSFFSSSFTKPTARLYRNTDASGAGTFTQVLGQAGMGRTSVAFAPSATATVYAIAACTSDGTVACGNFEDGVYRVYRSVDSGASWAVQFTNNFATNYNAGGDGAGYPWGNLIFSNAGSAVCNSSVYGQGWYDNDLAVNPVNANQIFAGGIDLFRSDDGGATWGALSYWFLDPSATQYAHADHHRYVFHPGFDGTSVNRFYVGNDGGIQWAADAHTATRANRRSQLCPATTADLRAATWTSLNNSLGITQFYHGDVYPDGTTYFGGTQDNGTNRGSDGAGINGWSEILGGDGGYVAVNPGNTNQLFAENFGLSIQRSDDGGTNFASKITGITESANNFQFINPFTMDPNTATRLWTGGTRMWRTGNSGDTWTAASTVITTTCAGSGAAEFFSAHAVAPGNSNLVLAGGDCGFIHRNSAATTATGTTVWANVKPRDGYVSSFAFDPSNTQIAYATYSTFGGAHVWRTADGGATWTSIDGSGGNALPDVPVHSVLVDPRAATTLWVGTDLGVFVTVDGGNNWARENTGFANVFTEHLDLHQIDANNWKLYAFTHGRGVFMAPLSNLVGNAPTITGPGNQTINEDGNTGALAVTVGDTETPVNSLSLTGSSSDTTLIPNANVVTGGSGSARTVTVTPAANRSGSATITLTVVDSDLRTATANFTVTVNAVNDVPSFTKGGDQVVNEDAGAQTVNPWATALSAGPFEAQSLNFEITANSNAALFAVAPAVSATGVLTYTPTANTSGVATITLRICDNGAPVECSPTQDFTITVNAVNDPPSFTAGANQTVNEDAGAQSVVGWASAISSGPNESQTLNFEITGNTNAALFAVAPAVSAGGTLSYTPAANTSGVATITLRICDNGAPVECSPTQNFTITVNAVNDPPSFTAGANQTVNEDAGAQSVVGWASAISSGPNESQTLNFEITGNTNAALFAVAPAVSAGGTLSYTPAANTSGVATITLRICDNGAPVECSPSQDFSITVNAVNDPPSFVVGADQSVVENSGATTVPGWATSLSSGPNEAQNLSFEITANSNAALFAAGPAVSAVGTLSFTPATDTSGSATITLRVCDDGVPVACSPTQSFLITVTPATFVDFLLTKSNGSSYLVEGQTTVYTILVRNNGNTSGTAAVADNLAPGLASMSWTCSGTGCGAASGNGNLLETITLAAGAELTYTVTAVVNGAIGSTVDNFASVEALTPPEADTNADNSATDSDPIRDDDLFLDSFEL
jgi:hypothetical protein